MLRRLALLTLLGLLAWWPMMAVHELGHVLAAMATGGTVREVELHPLRFSRTDVQPNPRPLVVAWAGPAFGVAGPLVLAATAPPLLRRRRARRALGASLWFFAGFCLIANGGYIGAGWVERIGDAGTMLRLGTPRWAMAAFGATCLAGGLSIWHRLAGPARTPAAGNA